MSAYPFVRPYIRMGRLVSHWTDFHEIWYLRDFRKHVEEIKSFINISHGTLHDYLCKFMIVSHSARFYKDKYFGQNL
jgi:hypothetical protein